ncbi:MAG: CCA tRNA nucleotidyltransferase [Lachnospiraceae bacterium]|nr:CCA tRNA nucleotidyltransferase [Lachnospiraceae bacterium]
MKIKLPESVELIIRILEDSGYEAYAVGGCVRDAVMGRIPNDWDITTSAKADEVKAIFNKTIDTGIKHGTVTVMIGGVGYEVTTFRVDGEYEDGRHPKEVQFTDNLTLDLERRDFTINAMAYNNRTGIVDKFDGMGDIDRRIIRCVGDPLARFSEDALRILRAVRFAAQLDFQIDEDTISAIKTLKGNLSKISRERIQVEMDKLLMSDKSDKVYLLHSTGVIGVVFDETDSTIITKSDKWWKDTAKIVKGTPKNHYIRWAALFRDEEKPEAAVRSLKFDNKTLNIVSKLVKNSKTYPDAKAAAVRRHMCVVGADIYQMYLDYMESVCETDVCQVRKIYNEIIKNGDCLSIGDMQIKGSDLKEIGIEPGKAMGEVLGKLFDMVLDNPEKNNKEELIKKAKEFA